MIVWTFNTHSAAIVEQSYKCQPVQKTRSKRQFLWLYKDIFLIKEIISIFYYRACPKSIF